MGKTGSLLATMSVLVAFGMSSAQAEDQKMKTNLQQKVDGTAKGVTQNLKARTVPQSGNNNSAGMSNAGRKKK